MRKLSKLLLFITLIMIITFVSCGDQTPLILTIELDGQGTVNPSEGVHEYNLGQIVNLIATPSEEWVFKHWIGDVADNNNSNTTVTMDSNKSVIVVFEEKSTTDPTPIEPGEPGNKISYIAGGVKFKMVHAPAATFPTGFDDAGRETVDKAYWIGETPVTYELWYTVRMWAIDNARGANKYTFANEGMEGSVTGGGSWPNFNNVGNPPTSAKNEPVTMVSWRDALVWTNALSEMLGLEPVYRYNGNIIRDATNAKAFDNAEQTNNNGFRLPTEWEWELSARFIGQTKPSNGPDLKDEAFTIDEEPGIWWTPGQYASGAYADYNNASETGAVAWYWDNSGGKTQNVGTKRANQLGIYDMSGNVWEWTFTSSGSSRVFRGGSWRVDATYTRVAYRGSHSPTGRNRCNGFRLAGHLE